MPGNTTSTRSPSASLRRTRRARERTWRWPVSCASVPVRSGRDLEAATARGDPCPSPPGPSWPASLRPARRPACSMNALIWRHPGVTASAAHRGGRHRHPDPRLAGGRRMRFTWLIFAGVVLATAPSCCPPRRTARGRERLGRQHRLRAGASPSTRPRAGVSRLSRGDCPLPHRGYRTRWPAGAPVDRYVKHEAFEPRHRDSPGRLAHASSTTKDRGILQEDHLPLEKSDLLQLWNVLLMTMFH